ncbi:hypothetical protein KFZ76_13720 [Methylovulum psychrotolerans]|uniref:hypothetical protein n=1 Tax=Methylovulum psychrotolerans TaxID=1704499 RepID=UPI001BFFBF7D|nr:hypothetical protein [Methylovulum psychrotolerans]MBT9098763.1 hypothetical protein [Methylovulum psychrotolerans]
MPSTEPALNGFAPPWRWLAQSRTGIVYRQRHNKTANQRHFAGFGRWPASGKAGSAPEKAKIADRLPTVKKQSPLSVTTVTGTAKDAGSPPTLHRQAHGHPQRPILPPHSADYADHT